MGWMIGPRGERFYYNRKAPAPTAKSIARHNASAAYTRSGRATMGGAAGGITIDAQGTLDWMEKLKMQYLGKAGVRRIVREEIVKARKVVAAAASQAMDKDPRKAAKGVQMLVYKGGGKTNEGGNINILRPRKNESTRMVNWRMMKKYGSIRRRRRRSAKTNQIDGYTGKSRYFVLHWIDAGAHRSTRGDVTATHFFTQSAPRALRTAAVSVKNRVAGLIAKTK